MWSFYTLAVMFSINFIMSIAMFGNSKVLPFPGGTKASCFVVAALVLWVFWSFLDPLNITLGAYLFGVLTLLVFINTVRDLDKATLVSKYGYKRFFINLIYLVGLFLYQFFVK